MGQITVNGQTFKGKEVKVYMDVDGVNVFSSSDQVVKIDIIGDTDLIQCGSGDITMQGTAHYVKTGSGNIKITGNVQYGDVTTGSGDVTVGGNITGSVKTGSGNVKL
jgi:hypothetical protein